MNLNLIYYKDEFQTSNLNFSNVYYLECPDSYVTEFKDFNIECKEGDILSFPAFLPHRSPIIDKEERKTVIAFNTNITFP